MNVLVVGGSGRCGAAVVRRLLDGGHDVRLLTRDPDGSRAASLAAAGATAVRGDFLAPETLPPAFAGVERCYVVTTGEHGFEQEERGGANVIAAAAAAGVEHVVLQSVIYADTEMPHCATKGRVEQELAASGLDHAVLRAGYFLETLPSYLTPQACAAGEIVSVIHPAAPVWWVSVADLAAAAVALLGSERPPTGRFDAVTADPMSFDELAAELSRLSGRRWTCRHVPLDVEQMMGGAVTHGLMAPEQARAFLASVEDPGRDYYEVISAGAIVPDSRPLERVTRRRFRSPREAVALLAEALPPP